MSLWQAYLHFVESHEILPVLSQITGYNKQWWIVSNGSWVMTKTASTITTHWVFVQVTIIILAWNQLVTPLIIHLPFFHPSHSRRDLCCAHALNCCISAGTFSYRLSQNTLKRNAIAMPNTRPISLVTCNRNLCTVSAHHVLLMVVHNAWPPFFIWQIHLKCTKKGGTIATVSAHHTFY